MNEEIMLRCSVCGAEFAFTAQDKALYARLGFDNPPRRCTACRGSAQAIEAAVKPKRLTYAAICCTCGKETQLPFKPTGEKPVYCSDCFSKHRA